MRYLPQSCYIGKIIPKDNFNNFRDDFTNKVERIRYIYQISDKTTNYRQDTETDAIVVINIKLKSDSDITNIAKEINSSIVYNIIYEIEYNNKKKYGFYDKKLFTTDYEDETSFNFIASDVVTLYDSLKKQILGETIQDLSSKDLVEKHIEIEKLQLEIEKLEKKRRSEKQLNKRIEIKAKINRINYQMKEEL